jgi:hypothetical protein
VARAVDSDEFREWMAPKVDGIRAFTAAVRRVLDERGNVPGHPSRALEELAEERNYRARSSWTNPVTDTHTFGAMTLLAATDYVRTFGELFASPEPPLYAHLVVGRSVFESGVVSAWLSEPGISALDRMKRGLCEQLYSALEVDRLGIADDARVDEWRAVGDRFGWKVDVGRRTNPSVDGERRPRVSDGIVSLAGRDRTSPVGNLLYVRMSAVAHVTWFGLQSALDFTEVVRDELSRFATVALTVDSERVCAAAYYVLRVLRGAAAARFTLMGWSDPAWEEAVQRTSELERTFAQATLSAGE